MEPLKNCHSVHLRSFNILYNLLHTCVLNNMKISICETRPIEVMGLGKIGHVIGSFSRLHTSMTSLTIYREHLFLVHHT
jgi:hypothetical protein